MVRLSESLAEDTDTPAATWFGVGGQAANVAAWVMAMGGRSRLIAARGTDLGARLVTEELRQRGVDVVGPIVPGATGVVVSISADGRKRSMLTDRGVGTELAAAALRADWLDGCDWLHIPGYSLVREPIRGAALAAAAAASRRSARLSVDLSSTSALASFGVGDFRALISRLRPDLVLGNEAEAELVGDLAGLQLVVKLGHRGVRAAGRHYPALPTHAVDATGAGDAFAAGYLLGGITLGLQAAARAVAKMGAMP